VAGTDAWHFAVAVPAGTQIAAPLVTPTHIPARRITRIHWRIPPGASGFVGFRVSMGGVQVIPQNAGAFIVSDSMQSDWTLAELPESGQWDVTAYNTGAFPHTVYVTYTGQVITREPDPFRLFTDDELSAYPPFTEGHHG